MKNFTLKLAAVVWSACFGLSARQIQTGQQTARYPDWEVKYAVIMQLMLGAGS